MTGCQCHHAASVHAPREQFGQSMCLSPDCDCMGTETEIVEATVQRVMAKQRVRDDLTDVIRNAACGLPDAMAYDVAVAILEKFNVEIK